MKPAAHQYEDKLLEFAYGELAQSEASAVEAHVHGCARCTEALNEIRSVRFSMAAMPQVEAPQAGLDSLFAYAEQAARRNAAGPASAPSFWKRLVAPLAGVAAVALVGVVGWQSQKDLNIPTRDEMAQKVESDRRVPPIGVAQGPMPAAVAPVADSTAAAMPVEEKLAANKEGLQPEGRREAGPKNAKQDRGGAAADDFDNSFGDERRLDKAERAPAQQAYGATVDSNERQQQDLGKMVGAAEKASRSRREVVAKDVKQKVATKGALEDVVGGDYSNAVQRGAVAKPKPADAPAAEPTPAPVVQVPVASAPPAEKPAPQRKSGFGLSATNAGAGGKGAAESTFEESETIAAAPNAGLGDAKRITASAPPPPPARTASVGTEAYRDADKKPAASGGKDVEQSLAGARNARSRNDRTQEIALAQRALTSGAQGAQRAEALQRLCDAFDALGQEGQADQYCSALLREFPGSASAQAIAQRRNQPQLSPSAPGRAKAEKKSSADEAQKADEKKALPAAAY